MSNTLVTALFEADYERFLASIGSGSQDFDDWLRGPLKKHRYRQAELIFQGIDGAIVQFKISDIPQVDFNSANGLVRTFYSSPRNAKHIVPRLNGDAVVSQVHEVMTFFQLVAKHHTEGKCLPDWATGSALKKQTLTEILRRRKEFDVWEHKDRPLFIKLASLNGFDMYSCASESPQSVVNLGKAAMICLAEFIEKMPNDPARYKGQMIYKKVFSDGGIQFMTKSGEVNKPLVVFCIWGGKYLLEIAGRANTPPNKLEQNVQQALREYLTSRAILPADERAVEDISREIPSAKGKMVSCERGIIYLPNDRRGITLNLIDGRNVLAQFTACSETWKPDVAARMPRLPARRLLNVNCSSSDSIR